MFNRKNDQIYKMSKNAPYIDFRLLDISFEIYTLKNHFDTIKREIVEINNKEKEIIERLLRDNSADPNSSDYYDIIGAYEEKVNVLIPRIFYNPFLVTLYSVFESGITEIAQNIKEKKKLKLGFNEINGSLLKRAKRYYEEVLHFPLYNNKSDWDRVNILSDLRNAIAHTNGRLDLLSPSSRRKFQNYTLNKLGIHFVGNFLVVEESLIEIELVAVNNILSHLINRYKKWDDELT